MALLCSTLLSYLCGFFGIRDTGNVDLVKYLHIIVFTVDMCLLSLCSLNFRRETRKADTQEKYLELVETFHNPSLIPRF